MLISDADALRYFCDRQTLVCQLSDGLGLAHDHILLRLNSRSPCTVSLGPSKEKLNIPHHSVQEARAHRWQRLLESGETASITEFAAAEKIDRSYLCRVLRLTLLAPEIVEAIMDGRQAEDVTLPGLMKGFPVEWEGQKHNLEK